MNLMCIILFTKKRTIEGIRNDDCFLQCFLKLSFISRFFELKFSWYLVSELTNFTWEEEKMVLAIYFCATYVDGIELFLFGTWSYRIKPLPFPCIVFKNENFFLCYA